MMKKQIVTLFLLTFLLILVNRIGGVMVSMLASGAVDCGFEPWSGQTKDYKIGICCFSAKHAAFRRKSKDWLARNQDNVSKWGDISTRGLLFQWASTIKIQLSMLVEYKADLIIISLKINKFSPWYSWKIAELAINNNQSLTHSNISSWCDILSILTCLIIAYYIILREDHYNITAIFVLSPCQDKKKYCCLSDYFICFIFLYWLSQN